MLSMLRNDFPIAAPEARPSDRTFVAMLRYFGLLRRTMEPFFAQYHIGVSQWAVLRVLQRANREGRSGLSLKELSGRLLVRPPSVTGVVSRLKRMGLVATAASCEDHRIRLVSLTPRGLQLVEMIAQAHSQRIGEVFAALDESELDLLRESLGKLCGKMETMCREAGQKDEA